MSLKSALNIVTHYVHCDITISMDLSFSHLRLDADVRILISQWLFFIKVSWSNSWKTKSSAQTCMDCFNPFGMKIPLSLAFQGRKSLIVFMSCYTDTHRSKSAIFLHSWRPNLARFDPCLVYCCSESRPSFDGLIKTSMLPLERLVLTWRQCTLSEGRGWINTCALQQTALKSFSVSCVAYER